MTITGALIDSREPSWVLELDFGAPNCAVTLLEHGDLLITTSDQVLLCVERKTADDLLGSLKDGRLWPQLAGMVGLTRWSYLVITGAMPCGAGGYVCTERGVTGWSWSALQGALLRAQELGVFVIQAADDADFEGCVIRLAGRDHNSTTIIPPLKMPVVLGDAEKILTALPGIGLERVKPLIEYASNPAWALAFLTDLNCEGKVTGIGAGTKRAIRRALGLGAEEELAIVLSETGQLAPCPKATECIRCLECLEPKQREV